jgi:hypothetical protein
VVVLLRDLLPDSVDHRRLHEAVGEDGARLSASESSSSS